MRRLIRPRPPASRVGGRSAWLRVRAPVVVRTAGGVGLVGLALAVDLMLWSGDGTLRSGVVVPAWAITPWIVAAFLVLLVRRRFPIAVFVAVWSYSVVGAAVLPSYQPCLALFIALHQVARRFPFRRALPFLLVSAAPITLNLTNAVQNYPLTIPDIIGMAVLWVVLFGMVWVGSRLGYRTEEKARLLEATRAAEARLAIQAERMRLARELHDSVASSVNAIVFQSAGLQTLNGSERGVDPITLERTLVAIQRSSTDAVRELRRLLGLLHTSGPGEELHGLEVGSTLAEVDRLLEMTRACSVEVELLQEGRPRQVAPEIDHVAFRVVQEALANVIKHDGAGSRAVVGLRWETADLRISVTSVPGAGSPARHGSAASTGLGLSGLQDRVAAAGGEIHSGWSAGGEFTVDAWLPAPPERPRAQPAPGSPRSPLDPATDVRLEPVGAAGTRDRACCPP